MVIILKYILYSDILYIRRFFIKNILLYGCVVFLIFLFSVLSMDALDINYVKMVLGSGYFTKYGIIACISFLYQYNNLIYISAQLFWKDFQNSAFLFLRMKRNVYIIYRIFANFLLDLAFVISVLLLYILFGGYLTIWDMVSLVFETTIRFLLIQILLYFGYYFCKKL